MDERMRGFFSHHKTFNTQKCVCAADLVQNKIREQNLWEHLGRKIQPVTPRHICVSQPCVYSDAQFIPPLLINRSDTETVGDGRGKV